MYSWSTEAKIAKNIVDKLFVYREKKHQESLTPQELAKIAAKKKLESALAKKEQLEEEGKI